MLNVVIPITDKLDKYRELLNGLRGMINSKILIGTNESFFEILAAEYKESNNFAFFQFDNKSNKEEMLNAMQDYLEEGPIMVLRKPITVNEFNKMVSLERDVVTSKVVRGKFASFMFKIWQKVTKLILGVKMYAGDTSAILFQQDIAEVVRYSGSLSYSSRVNRWKGVRQAVLTTSGQPEQIAKDKTQNFRYILFASLLLVVAATVTTVVCLFTKVSIIVGLLLFCLDAICLVCAIVLIIMLIFSNMTGKRNYKTAEIITKNIKGDI